MAVIIDFFKRFKKCGLCPGRLGEGYGVILYKVADTSEVQEMAICKACGDRLEAGALKVEDFSEE